MPLPLKELVKLNQIIERIQSGRFDANDVDNLLMKLRPYAERSTTLFEVANFVAHSDARNRGLAWESITAFADSMRFYMDYTFEQRSLNIAEPFPSYIYRVFLSKCSGLMKPDTLLGENARQIEVSDDQTTPYLFR